MDRSIFMRCKWFICSRVRSISVLALTERRVWPSRHRAVSCTDERRRLLLLFVQLVSDEHPIELLRRLTWLMRRSDRRCLRELLPPPVDCDCDSSPPLASSSVCTVNLRFRVCDRLPRFNPLLIDVVSCLLAVSHVTVVVAEPRCWSRRSLRKIPLPFFFYYYKLYLFIFKIILRT